MVMLEGPLMNLNQLRYYYAVLTAGNYSRAANELGVSQPAVYKVVRNLEKACGTQLIEWAGKRAHPTSLGTILYQYASQVAGLNDLAEAAIIEQKRLGSGRISIGAVTPVVCCFLAQALTQWMAENPGVTAHVARGHPEMKQLVFEDKIDLLLTRRLNESSGLHHACPK